MSRLELPAIDPSTVPVKRGPGTGYPEPFKSRMGDRTKRRLGDDGAGEYGAHKDGRRYAD